jgi:hypothetical protein
MLWNLFMSSPEIKTGLKKLGFSIEKHEKELIEKNMHQLTI